MRVHLRAKRAEKGLFLQVFSPVMSARGRPQQKKKTQQAAALSPNASALARNESAACSNKPTRSLCSRLGILQRIDRVDQDAFERCSAATIHPTPIHPTIHPTIHPSQLWSSGRTLLKNTDPVKKTDNVLQLDCAGNLLSEGQLFGWSVRILIYMTTHSRQVAVSKFHL